MVVIVMVCPHTLFQGTKANCLGRLIIDYFPVNQLIQSPNAVILEIKATIQFLLKKILLHILGLKMCPFKLANQ